MPRIKIQSGSKEQIKKIEDVVKKTEILKKEFELEFGKWNFVVIGQAKNGDFVIREGYAKSIIIQKCQIYSAALGDPSIVGDGGIPIEEFVADEIPKELNGLNVYHIDPLRPLTVSKKIIVKGDSAYQKAIEDYSQRRCAVITTPDESYWFISVLRYLNECDKFFPDEFIQSLKRNELPYKARFLVGNGSRFLN